MLPRRTQRLLSILALLAGLVGLVGLAGCAETASPSGAAAARGRLAPAGGSGRADAQLIAAVRAGQFDLAFALIDEQARSAGARGDNVQALRWRTRGLWVHRRRGDAKARGELAALLAGDPASADPRFVLSPDWADLLAALAEAGRDMQAERLMRDRFAALEAVAERDLWWHRQMADLAGRARGLGDLELAGRAERLVRLPAGDPGRTAARQAARPSELEVQPSFVAP